MEPKNNELYSFDFTSLYPSLLKYSFIPDDLRRKFEVKFKEKKN